MNPNFSRFAKCLAWLALGCLPGIGFAASDSGEKQRLQQLLTLDLTQLLDVVVTVAAKTEQTVAKAPSSVTVFTRREIDHMGITNLGELLDFVPGFQTFRLGLNGDTQGFQVRGNPMLPVFTRDVLVLVDGRRLNGSHSGGAVLYNPYLNLDNARQVEVIRGPGSALYGSNAFLGVINIVTLDDRNRLLARGGTAERKEMALNGAWRGAGWRGSAFARAAGDQGMGFDGLVDRFGRQGRARDARRGADVDLKIQKGDFEGFLRHTQRWSRGFVDSEYLGDNGINRSESEQSSLAFRYEHIFSDRLSARLSGGYTRSQLFFLADVGEYTLQGAPERFGLLLENDAVNLEGDLEWRFGKDRRLQAGLTVENTGNTDNALLETGPDGGIRYLRGAEGFTENRDRDIFGLYAQWQQRFLTNWEWVAGVRYDHYSDFGDTLNPRGALLVDLPWKDRLKFLYGQAFRAPNLADLTLNVGNSKGNPDLRPEKVETLELAYVHTAKYGQGIVTLFRNHVTDRIAIEPDASGQFFAYNQGQLDRTGLEWEVSLKPAPDWLLRATYTHIFEGRERHAPGHFGSLIANRQWGVWNFNLNTTYQGPIPSLEQPRNTWVANASVRYQWNRRLSLQATGRNLTDQTILDPPEFTAPWQGKLQGLSPGIPSRGRHFWVGMEIEFE